MTAQAQAAIHAAKNLSFWGRWAARRYAQKRGVSPRLYRIARQCQAIQEAGL